MSVRRAYALLDRPAPRVGPGPPVVRGSRPGRVCLDVPPSAYGAGGAFRGELSAGRNAAPGSPPEFRVAGPPARVPLRRLNEERPVSARVDPARAGIGAARARHEELGAVAAQRSLPYVRTTAPLPNTRTGPSVNRVTEKPEANIGMPAPCTIGYVLMTSSSISSTSSPASSAPPHR